ncbi:uncharacterized protein TNIN_259241 [Trichonephila inaurata madagascariensis]|uniref:Mutator-like transposase domain-containing protein n=1 Tax=Trichonephila inaurata madagascariensis TaxID=2747483 RepID=A0A8X7C2V5_9ARAC|nr:uncharacterized protein TNIN_259241 [Trichonephila inaurata madagascariensis]
MRRGHNKEDDFEPEEAESISIAPTSKSKKIQAAGIPEAEVVNHSIASLGKEERKATDPFPYRASTKVFKKRRGVFNKGSCKKINDGCVEGISTVPKNCADEKNFADGAKLCTNETEPSATCVFFEAVKCLKREKTGLRLHLNESYCGKAVKFHLKCPSCKYNYTFLNSKKCDISENYELNTRLVYDMRCIGKGAESARMFCGIMNLPPPLTKFLKYNNILLQATRETCEDSMEEAVREAVDENDGKKDIAVAVDVHRGGLNGWWTWRLPESPSVSMGPKLDAFQL